MALHRSLPTVVAVAAIVATGLAPAGATVPASPVAPAGPVAPAAPVDGMGHTSPQLTRQESEARRDHARRVLEAHQAAGGTTVLGGAVPSPDVTGPAPSDPAATSVHPVVTRHSGTDRYGTAAALARTMWADLFWAPVDGEPYPFDKVVFLASGENYPDALSAGALAAAYAGPVLLTKKDGMPAVTRSALTALAPDHIIVIGGEEAVADDVIWEAAEYVSSLDHVVRRGGKNRWEVSAGLARDTLGAGASTAYVALGTNWPDGLAGGATAGTEMAPLLLTKTDYVPSVVLSALRSGSLDRIVVLGGSQVISQNVLDQLGAIAPVTRVEGGNRYEVAANAADLHGTAYSATAASGQNWPDALAGSAYAGLVGDKMLLLKQEGVPTVTRQAVREHGLAWIEVLGGPVPLPDAVLDSLRAMTVEIPD